MSDQTQLSIADPDDNDDDQPQGGGYFADLDKLRISPDYAANLGIKRLLTHVPVRRPDRQWFVRVHPDAAYRIDVAVLEIKDEGETYFVDPALHLDLSGDLTYKTLFTTINRQGIPFLWPVRLPREDGRIDDWNRVARDAAEMAVGRWVKVAANKPLGTYDLFEAAVELPDPEWPTESMEQLLEVAFRDKVIRDPDHPIIQQLQGRV